MEYYYALGLCILSDVELSSLPPLRSQERDQAQPKVVVRQSSEMLSTRVLPDETSRVFGPGSGGYDDADDADAIDFGVFRTASGWFYRSKYEDKLAEVLVSHNGTEILWNVAGGVAPSDIASLISGVMLSAAATAQGVVVLHGTVLQTTTRCVAVLADSGAGKSTFAAAMIAAGAELISEDAFSVDVEDLRVLTAQRLLRLSDQTVLTFDRDPEQFPQVHLVSNKRLVPPGALRPATSRPRERRAHVSPAPTLDDLWFLERAGEGEQPGLVDISASDAFRRLHMTMHPTWMHTSPSRSTFEFQSALVNRVPAQLLKVPDSIDALGDFVRTFAER